MICFLDGILVEKHPTRAVLNVGGVGYDVLIPLSSYDRLPAPGERCLVLTHDHVREDDHQLFGFATEAERRVFVLLMTVSGIGPKLALSALSGMSARELKAAIVEGDAKRLSSISGIGKKTAERMIVELRDKIGAGEALEATAGAPEALPEDLKLRDAVLALIALGYKRADAEKMVLDVAKAPGAGEHSVEDIIRKSLAR